MVADREPRMKMRCAHRPHKKSISRADIRSEYLGAIHLSLAVKPLYRGADRLTGLGHGAWRGGSGGRGDGGNDLGVSGAAAEHACQRLFDLRLSLG